MNTERLRVLERVLREKKLPDNFFFNMNFDYLVNSPFENRYGYDRDGQYQDRNCGTVGCIAGLTHALFGQGKYGGFNASGDLLGLDRETSDDLFLPGGYYKSYEYYTMEECADAVRNVLEHGGPLWSEILK